MPKRKCFDVDSALGENLAFFRKRVGMTQQQVADLLNINRTTYTKYETGVSEPSIELLKRLAEIFETDVSMLVDDDFSPFELALSDSDDDFAGYSNDIRELMAFYRLLSKDDKKKVIDYARKLTMI